MTPNPEPKTTIYITDTNCNILGTFYDRWEALVSIATLELLLEEHGCMLQDDSLWIWEHKVKLSIPAYPNNISRYTSISAWKQGDVPF